MRFLVNGKIYEVTLRGWNGESYGEDFFADLEEVIPSIHKRDADNAAYVLKQEELDELVEYWENEVDIYNEGKRSEQFGTRAADSPCESYLIEVTCLGDAAKFE